MILEKAIELRDIYKPLVVGKVLLSPNKPEPKEGHEVYIQDVIIAPVGEATNVYMVMKERGLTNEKALLLFGVDNVDVYVFSFISKGYPVVTELELKKYLDWTKQWLPEKQ